MMPRRERGFTLIELMLTLAVGGIVLGVISQVVYMTSRSFTDQLTLAESQQNARAVISLMKRYTRMAGWGMAVETDTTGNVPLGACFNTADSSLESLLCDNIDDDKDGLAGHPNGMDRLRATYLIPTRSDVMVRQGDGATVTSTGTPNEVNPIPVMSTTHPDPGWAPHAGNPVGLVSGPCTGGGSANDIITIGGNTGAAGFWYGYDFTRLNGLGTNTVTCPNGIDGPFSFGQAMVADFWIDRTTSPNHPTLMVRFDPTDTLASGMVVAYDVDDLQVSYLLDVECFDDPLTGADECGGDTTLPDYVWDIECDNLDDSSTDTTQGYCNNANVNPMTTRERFNRVMGVRVAVVARTRTYTERWDDSPSYIWVQNHRFFGEEDGYKRWIYRATMLLRNNEL